MELEREETELLQPKPKEEGKFFLATPPRTEKERATERDRTKKKRESLPKVRETSLQLWLLEPRETEN
jgi:thymidylate kinase